MTLQVRLFGGVDVHHAGVRVPVESGRVESLLAYLLLHRDTPQSRQHLAFLLWPDTTDAQARTNLRHVLHTLRRTLPDADVFIEATARTLQWRAEAPWELDVAAFDAALALHRPREAVDLYRGDLVPGCYDEWLLVEREIYRQRHLDALRRLVGALEAAGDSLPAIAYAERLLVADPLNEETYRLLMRLHDGRGDRARALHVYHDCTSTLERELGVAPAAATREAYDALLATDEGDVDRPTMVGSSPFVGRNVERKQLTAAWRAAESGRGSLVLVTGEAGIGKSRLVDDFRSWCDHEGAVTAEARSYAAEGELAYGPVAGWLRSAALRDAVAGLEPDRLTELARLLPELIGWPGVSRPEPMQESDHRHVLFETVSGALLLTGRPLLLVAEDAHWCDRETLQFLHFLVRTAADARLCVVVTARREEVDAGSPLAELIRGVQALDRLTELDLGRLSRQETAALAERLTGSVLPAEAAERLWRETEGNPLFIVESVRAGWAEGERASPKVQAVIESRLAQLSGPARELVETAAAIGRDFTVELLSDVSDADEDTLVQSLDELWRRRILREEEGGTVYDFSHDRIRAVAYAGLSPVRRRRHHRRIARALERSGAEEPGRVSAMIAAHLDLAGETSEAVDWYTRAAAAAQQLHANAEAVRLLDRARDAVLTLPKSRLRDERELGLLTALPAPLASVEGYLSSRLSVAHDRAVQLAEELGREPGAPLLWSLAFASLVREDFVRAERFAGEMRDRGEREADDVVVVEGACLLGIAKFWQADFAAARHHFDVVVDRYRGDRRAEHLLRYGQDPQVVALARLGNTLWFLGDAAGAERARDAALARSDEIAQPLTRGAALVFAGVLALDTGDDVRVRDHAAALAALSSETHPIRYVTEALSGYVDVLDGAASTGVGRIRRAIEDAGPQPAAPGMRALLTRVELAALVAAGDTRGGLAAAHRLLDMGGPARVWATEARRQVAALSTPASDRNA